MSSCEGQFNDFDEAVSTGRDALGKEESPEDSSSGEEGWELEYEDWQGEAGDFTKKLNAVRAGQTGANAQQGKGRGTGQAETVSQKAIQVKLFGGQRSSRSKGVLFVFFVVVVLPLEI